MLLLLYIVVLLNIKKKLDYRSELFLLLGFNCK